MKLRWLVVLSVGALFQTVDGAEKTELKDQKDKVSYSIGINLGTSFKKQSVDISPEILLMGLKDALSGGKLLLTEEQAAEVMQKFQTEMMTKQAEMKKASTEKNKKAGETFLAENKKKEGVKALPSGLQYKVMKGGTGKTPKATDTVTTQYRGTLIDGTEFDSSYKHGQPMTFPVSGVIKGWTEALQLMKEGDKWQLFIPSNLAYGEGGTPSIGPNSTLIFEIELISIK